MTRMPAIVGILSALAVLIVCGGCAHVAFNERELLAKRIMMFDLDDREAALQRVIDKAQYEGVMGGGTLEGSGCGCN